VCGFTVWYPMVCRVLPNKSLARRHFQRCSINSALSARRRSRLGGGSCILLTERVVVPLFGLTRKRQTDTEANNDYVSPSEPFRKFFDLLKMRLSPLVSLVSGTSNAYRSLLLALSSSTIKKLIEYIVLLPFCDHRFFVKTLIHSLNRQRDQNQIRDSAVVGTNCRLQNSEPAGQWELDLSVWRSVQRSLRNNLLQAQWQLQELPLVTPPASCGLTRCRDQDS
jgi:hypothetical protein